MTNSQRLATVRARLIQWLADQRGTGKSPVVSENPIVRESILIRGEYYCGRRFHTADHHAVWFIEEDELKIYRSSGELECVLSGEQISNRATAGDEPHHEVTQKSGLPSVIKMPPPVETNFGANGDSENEVRRAA
jgi:hypothetical protein